MESILKEKINLERKMKLKKKKEKKKSFKITNNSTITKKKESNYLFTRMIKFLSIEIPMINISFFIKFLF